MVDDEDEDTRGQRTLAKCKNYSLKSAIFNWAKAWDDVKQTTLANAWSKLFQNKEAVQDFDGFEPYQATLRRGGEEVAADDIMEWLEADEGDPGFEIMTDEEIAESVQRREDDDSDDDDGDDDDAANVPRPRLSQAREAADVLLSFLDGMEDDAEFSRCYNTIWELRDGIIQRQHRGTGFRQTR